jgi:hypothetical protein
MSRFMTEVSASLVLGGGLAVTLLIVRIAAM